MRIWTLKFWLSEHNKWSACAAVMLPSSTHLRTQRRPPASYSPAWPWRRGRRRSGGPRGCPPGGHGAPPPSRTGSRPRNRTGPPPQRRNVWKWKEYVEASLTDYSICYSLNELRDCSKKYEVLESYVNTLELFAPVGAKNREKKLYQCQKQHWMLC